MDALLSAYIPPKDHLLVSHIDSLPYLRSLKGKQIDLYHQDWGALQAIRQRGFGHVTIHKSPFPPIEATYEVAVVGIPKGREYAKAVLLRSLHAVKPNGLVLAIGHNKGGAKTAFADMKAIAPTRTLGTKNRYRMFSIERPAEIPDQYGKVWEPYQQTLIVNGESYDLYSHVGVFSHAHLDEGTAFLLDNLPNIAPQQKILDAGCGVGIIGMVAQRTLNPENVIYADVNLLAVDCVQRSLPNAEVIAADLASTPLEQSFDVILCNPPFHQGQETSTLFMQSFARHAHQMLNPNGQLILVANAFLPYKNLLQSIFTDVESLANNDQFQVLLANK